MRHICLVLISLTSTLFAGEQVVHEDFEKLELAKLPLGYSTFTQDLSIATDATQGKVLKIVGKGGDIPELSIQLDLAKVAGHTIRVVALAKMEKAFKPAANKPEAQPELKLLVKDSKGEDTVTRKGVPTEKPEWQRLSFLATIDRSSASAAISVGMNLVAGEILFDELSVEVDPDVHIELLAEMAAKAPVRKFDVGGMSFGPDVAEAMQKIHEKTKSTIHVIAYAGPGTAGNQDFESKPPPGLTVKTEKRLDDPPRALLAQLPEFLGREKPEIVYLIGDGGSARKLPPLEYLDWTDVAKLCGRLGAVPVLALPPATGIEDKDALRTAMLKAADAVHCPVLETGPALTGVRIGEMANLIQKFIFARDVEQIGSGKRGGGLKDE